MVSPGGTLGILGGGHLSRLLVQAAQTLGYRVHVFDPQPGCPAGAAADREVNGSYEDLAALGAFARGCDVVTCEWADIPPEPLAAIAPIAPLRPRPAVLHVGQNRQREKEWLKANGYPHVAYAEALDGDVAAAVAQVGRPAVVKPADSGHGGQGLMTLTTDADLEQAIAIFRGRRCLVERWCEFACEISVIVGRGLGGEVRPFPVAENIHAQNVLDLSIVPARVGAGVASSARQIAIRMAEKLQVVGLLAVEFFVTADGEVLANELAPRPHRYGHWTLDACETSQFEQHVRAVCGLPLGGTDAREWTVMVNLLGDVWLPPGKPPRQPDWAAVLSAPRAKLHLQGDLEPRPGRRMGHFTVRDADADTALARAREIKAQL